MNSREFPKPLGLHEREKSKVRKDLPESVASDVGSTLKQSWTVEVRLAEPEQDRTGPVGRGKEGETDDPPDQRADSSRGLGQPDGAFGQLLGLSIRARREAGCDIRFEAVEGGASPEDVEAVLERSTGAAALGAIIMLVEPSCARDGVVYHVPPDLADVVVDPNRPEAREQGLELLEGGWGDAVGYGVSGHV